MATDKHRATCVCNDCLPGGKQEHRARPWPVKVGECEHFDYSKAGFEFMRAETRLRVPLIGGDVLEICRLCGSLLGVEPK